MTAVTTWYTYPAQPLSPLIYLLWDSFVSVAKHMEFLLNYRISCSDIITSHMGLGTKHDSYNYWYSTKQCIKKKKTAISSITGGGGGGGACVWCQYMAPCVQIPKAEHWDPTDLVYIICNYA